MKSSLVISGKVLAVYEELETEEAIQTSITRVACMMPLAAVGPRTQSPRGSDRMLGSLSFQTFFFCAGRLNPGSIVLGKGSAPELHLQHSASLRPASPSTVDLSWRSQKAER